MSEEADSEKIKHNATSEKLLLAWLKALELCFVGDTFLRALQDKMKVSDAYQETLHKEVSNLETTITHCEPLTSTHFPSLQSTAYCKSLDVRLLTFLQ